MWITFFRDRRAVDPEIKDPRIQHATIVDDKQQQLLAKEEISGDVLYRYVVTNGNFETLMPGGDEEAIICFSTIFFSNAQQETSRMVARETPIC